MSNHWSLGKLGDSALSHQKISSSQTYEKKLGIKLCHPTLPEMDFKLTE